MLKMEKLTFQMNLFIKVQKRKKIEIIAQANAPINEDGRL